MNLKAFLERISRDGFAKIICFVLALFLYVSYRTTVMDKKTFTLPLQIVSEGSMTSESDMEHIKYVRVIVRGRAEQIATVTDNEFKAYCDISSQTKEGRYDFNVLVEPSSRVLLMEPLEITTRPEKVSLCIEENVFRYIPITPSIAGNPSYGYQITDQYVEPSTVKISGPKSIVDSIKTIYTGKVDIEGITQTSIKDVELVNENKLLHIEKPSSIRVTVKLQASGMIKDFKGIAIKCENLDESVEITNGPFYIDVTVEGELLEVENMIASRIQVTADCSNIKETGTYKVPVSVSIPNSLQLDYQSLTTLSINARKLVSNTEENAVQEDENLSLDANQSLEGRSSLQNEEKEN